ncbi:MULTISPECIES: sensor histidine kinase [unclassified Nocardioides]|uniref:sensor histidine kinase n=1 Tax=unclassified Nocardioides TaxID=2615069 RepID=UPI00070384DE|nr:MULTISPECIES: HAMP domain-containing sensor histidine kinase [unclassified Nocardioides]KRC53351.1 histidine kinase [Nocardioides sp. Root79]KRC70688.1 histidine kinase [Nocardioides sp. Root240]
MSGDQLQVVLIAAGWTSLVGLGGFAVARVTARRSLRLGLVLVALVAVGVVVAGVVGTADAMFISPHDRGVVLLVCLVAGLVAVALASVVGEAVVRRARDLQDAARRFGETGEYAASAAGPAELQGLSAELERTSARLREARLRERRLEESRRELVAWVSHDLRSPLAGLRAMAEALEDGMAEDPARYHRQMRSEVDRIVRMVDDLFELSRIQAGLLPVVPARVDLGDIVSEAIAGTTPVARAAGVRIDGRVAPGTTITADAAGMSRVVANLLVNAVRHTPADGVVTVSGRVTDDAVELSVRDACGGIPAADLPRLFDVAWRGTTARTPEVDARHGAGAGLGLAIVKGIVEAHHGAVRVANEAPGCCFSVQLPLGVFGQA